MHFYIVYTLLTSTRASFMAAQLETLQAHSSMRYGFEWPLDWPYSVNGSHWFNSFEQLDMKTRYLRSLGNLQIMLFNVPQLC